MASDFFALDAGVFLVVDAGLPLEVGAGLEAGLDSGLAFLAAGALESGLSAVRCSCQLLHVRWAREMVYSTTASHRLHRL